MKVASRADRRKDEQPGEIYRYFMEGRKIDCPRGVSTGRSSFIALKSFISALNFDWPFSCPNKLSISFDATHRYINIKQRLARFYFILTNSLVKCQTKSFEMKTLLLAIFKFCTTNQLFILISTICFSS